VEDQDLRTPEEEAEVEGHIKEEPLDQLLQKDDDDFEAHALREEPMEEPMDEPI
jgi:hypothetical protein